MDATERRRLTDCIDADDNREELARVTLYADDLDEAATQEPRGYVRRVAQTTQGDDDHDRDD